MPLVRVVFREFGYTLLNIAFAPVSELSLMDWRDVGLVLIFVLCLWLIVILRKLT
jgi:hypothetical protein